MGLEKHAGRLWASTFGEPLLVLEERRLPSWAGVENGDYARACSTTAEVDRILIDDGHGPVLGDEPAAAVRTDGVVFVRWRAANDLPAVERAIVAIERAAAVEAMDCGISLDRNGPAVVVFDSVEPGEESLRFELGPNMSRGDGALRVPLSSGRHSVRLGHVDPRVGSPSWCSS
jgi:Immunity protein 21